MRDPIADCVKLLPRPWQSLVVICGAILVHISLGTIYTFGNMLPYIVSYQKQNVSMAISDTWYTWLLTAQAGFQPIAGILGGALERQIGPRFTVHVGGLIMCTVELLYMPNWSFSNDGKKYFSQPDLLERVPYMFLILAACFATMQLIGSVFLFDPDQAEEEQDLIRPEAFSVTPRDALRSSTFYVLFLTFFCNSQTTYLITALYKRFGEANEVLNDDNYLAWVGSASSIFNAVGRPCWGALGDRFSYQVAMASLTISVAVFMLTLQITPILGRAAFIIWMCGIYFSLCGNFSLFPSVTAKAFGQKYMGINYGMVMSANTIAGIISSLLTEILKKKIGFSGMFFIVAGFSIIGFILTVFIQKTKHGKGISMFDDTSLDNPNYIPDKAEPEKDDPLAIWNENE